MNPVGDPLGSRQKRPTRRTKAYYNKGNKKIKVICVGAVAKIKALRELDRSRKVLAISIVKRIKAHPEIPFEDLTAVLAGEAKKRGMTVRRNEPGGRSNRPKTVEFGAITKIIKLLQKKGIILSA